MRKTLVVEPGQRFGRLQVTDPEVRKYVPSAPGGLRAARCRCDCGSELIVALTQLTRGQCVSCGCAKREGAADRFRSHDLTGHPLYNIHHGMMQRCYDSSHRAFRRYGGRGITVCAPWHDVRVFIAEIEHLLGPRTGGMTLDRIDNDGNYEPGNVRWATKVQQRRNSSQPLTPPRPGTPKFDKALVALQQNPMLSNAAIARQTGVSPHTVMRARRNLGLSNDEVAKRANVSAKTVSRARSELSKASS